jgi:uncharacterized protein YdhG (YjbR/CyaY superfamily)
MTDAKRSAKTAAASTKTFEGFTAEERAAMKERGRELKAAARRGSGAAADDEGAVLEKIAQMQEADRVLGELLHALVKSSTPELDAKLWYGMPAYAKDGKIICFFQPAEKFKARYATLGFSDKANLDDGAMWPTSYALTRLTSAEEKRIGALLKQATA